MFSVDWWTIVRIPFDSCNNHWASENILAVQNDGIPIQRVQCLCSKAVPQILIQKIKNRNEIRREKRNNKRKKNTHRWCTYAKLYLFANNHMISQKTVPSRFFLLQIYLIPLRFETIKSDPNTFFSLQLNNKLTEFWIYIPMISTSFLRVPYASQLVVWKRTQITYWNVIVAIDL